MPQQVGKSKNSKSKSSSSRGFDLELDPREIYFTHSKIRGTFTGCGKPVRETLQEILDGCTLVSDIPLIKVVFDGKRYISMNNRRLWVFKQLREMEFLSTIPVVLDSSKISPKMLNNTFSLQAKICIK